VCVFFFFQAEDGIRDFHVTGVQTCALPILSRSSTAVVVTRRETWVSPAARRGRRAGRPTRSGQAPYPTRFGSGPSSDAGSAAREIGRASCRERVESAGVAVVA